MKLYDVIRRPLVTEKGVEKKDNERTLCFEVALGANKTQVKTAVEKLFKVKVDGSADGHVRRKAAAPRQVSRAIAPTGRRPT